MVELDAGVVDAQAAQRREQMLDRLDRASPCEAGLQLLAAAQVGDVGGNLDAAEVGRAGNGCRSRPGPA